MLQQRGFDIMGELSMYAFHILINSPLDGTGKLVWSGSALSYAHTTHLYGAMSMCADSPLNSPLTPCEASMLRAKPNAPCRLETSDTCMSALIRSNGSTTKAPAV